MKRLSLITLCLLAAGCRNPFDRTHDASGGGPTGTLGTSSSFIIFGNELETGGGAFLFPKGDNQSLTFADTSNPVTRRSIRYSWTGDTVDSQTIFAGFDLMHVVDNTPGLTIYSSTPGRDLRKAGYTKVSFFARGALSSNTVLKIEVADDGDQNTASPCLTLSTDGNTADNACLLFGQFPNPLSMPVQKLTSSWQQYTITIPNSALANVKDFFKASFVFTPVFGAPAGKGGTAYLDLIQYEQ